MGGCSSLEENKKGISDISHNIFTRCPLLSYAYFMEKTRQGNINLIFGV